MEEDSGTYTCVVKNRFGEIKQFQKFVVKGKIKIFNVYNIVRKCISEKYLFYIIQIFIILGTENSMFWIITLVVLIIILGALLIYFCIKVRHEKVKI